MSDEGFMFRRLDRPKKTHSPNEELREALAKIRAESSTPPPLPRADVVPPPVTRRKIEKGITDHDRERARDAWHREAALAALLSRARGHAMGAKYVPPVIPMQPPPIRGAEERLESERTTFEQTEQDLRATFKKTFMPKPLSAEERMANEAARVVAHKFAAQTEPERVEPQSDMIKRLDTWLQKEKEKTERRTLHQRLTEHFPAIQNLEISRTVHGLAESLEQHGEEIVRDAQRHDLEKRMRFVSRWMRRRYDAFKRAGIAHLMNTFDTIGHSKTLGRGVALASVGLAFVSAISGSDEVREYLRSFMESGGTLPIASADMFPSFAPDSIADVSIPNPTEPVSVVNTEGSPNLIMVDGDAAGATVDSPVVEAGEAKPNMVEEGAPVIAEPIEVQGNVSVWSSLLDGLGEKGIDLSEKGEQAFAKAVQRAIEDTGTQSVFIEYKGEGLTDVAWDKIPDGATIHFDLLFGNQGFLDRLKELLESSEYRTLGKEIRSLGGAELFISDIQDAFGVQYL